MNQETLIKALWDCKENAELDYALDHGYCCNTCTNEYITEKCGANSHGIWTKQFYEGMNLSEPIENVDILFISHDLTENQKTKVFEILSKYFTVDWDKSDQRCIVIKDK